MGCHLVILACNTASAKALRSIQQNDLPHIDPSRRVLGVIRPTAERIGALTRTRHVGVLATAGTIKSESYVLEIRKLHPDITVTGEACPLWVPLVENNEFDKPGADYFVRQHIDRLLAKDPDIDAIILGCTHYPCYTARYAPSPRPTSPSSHKATTWLKASVTTCTAIPRWTPVAPAGAPAASSPPSPWRSSASPHPSSSTALSTWQASSWNDRR